ncbi:group III truncated hemoglobin [Cognatiluteimonas profundi]|uniref:group III truncated hemoglobin n=1 Tax=Cognatiluteimonas profundi TaxID=2594501 RepID=UPI00131D44DB|nr:group III truncated hemoglobin [Lysobacter profundi]
MDDKTAATAPAAELSADDIERLVDRFYDRVRVDPVLGPVFGAAVHDWPAHKRTLVSFWSSVALRAGTYRGNPMGAHRPHPIRSQHFDHWLRLWGETADAVLAPAHAELFQELASRIGRSLHDGLGLNVQVTTASLLAPGRRPGRL